MSDICLPICLPICIIKLFYSFEPRKAIRNAIKDADYLVDGTMRECISVKDKYGNNTYLPMFMMERVAVDCPPYPYINFSLTSVESDPRNVSATARKETATIEIDIAYTDKDNINVTAFGKKIADALVNTTRNNQCSIEGIDFLNIYNQGTIKVTHDCETVILHWILNLRAIYVAL